MAIAGGIDHPLEAVEHHIVNCHQTLTHADVEVSVNSTRVSHRKLITAGDFPHNTA